MIYQVEFILRVYQIFVNISEILLIGILCFLIPLGLILFLFDKEMNKENKKYGRES